jgi:hypothetical protein
MTVTRLRPLPSPEQLAAMYPAPHDHRIYGRGHHERVEATIALALATITDEHRVSVGDMSCGNGEIARRIGMTAHLHLGDFAPGYPYNGPLEQTLDEMPNVHTYICSETLEHVDDPAAVLEQIRGKAGHLVLSTPLECWDDANGEHLWAWDRQGVETLAAAAGWTALAFDSVDSRAYGEPYLYGLWVFR